MKKIVVLLLGVLFASVAWADSDDSSILKFKTMVGVSGPFLGSVTPQTPIQGVLGAGAAWMISEGRGELNSEGELEVHVRGLVLVRTGQNPLPNFRAALSCQSIDATGKPTTIVVSTEDFPATPAGDARIEAKVDVPSPCFAPIVFVTTSAGRWIAVTGH
jgi:hypothetical protein